ncbi:CehA/McbA family metallohydrolase [Rossellomorea sp. NS-SX7]|uniref:CehA/McbA family metallohydrolase n=1 Tax=Rossellomorea sp. NS-SX7 TaxID=3463856 RepID=UPI00405A13D1
MSTDKQLTLTETIDHSRQGEYLTLPFSVIDDMEEIKIELDFTDKESNVIDLGVEDPNGFRGWSGGARKEVFLREDRATPGYNIGELPEGKWGVILNAYRVPTVCSVTVKITCIRSKRRWYKGDLHLHTNHSDGAYTVSEVVENIRYADLDFLALTDHNTFSQNFQFPVVEDIAIIPGVELTTNKGHANFYGVHQPFLDFRCRSIEDVQGKMDEGITNGSFYSINHPHCQYCPWEWGLEHFDINMVEIWNGPWSEANQKTLDWWDSQLKQGEKVVAIGGSDTHREHKKIKYGFPTTWLNAWRHSPGKLVEAMKSGRACVGRTPASPWIEIKTMDTYMGGSYPRVNNLNDIPLEVEFKEKVKGIIKVITDHGTILNEAIDSQKVYYSNSISSDSKYVRVEVWDVDLEEPIVISNPIYFD